MEPQSIQPTPEETPQAETPQSPAATPVVDSTPKDIRLHTNSGSLEDLTEPGETVIFRIKKHPFGLLVFYVQAIVAFGLVSGLLYFLVPDAADTGQGTSARALLQLGIVIFGGILALISIAVTYVYRQNELLLTDRNVTQIIKSTIFGRQVSQLSLNNIEDVTADKRGFLPTLFNYGQIRIETAGEQNNFHFRYAPNPNHYGQLLVDTRAACIRRGGNSPPH